jgi:hypothetical protein
MALLAASTALFEPALAQPSMLCPGATLPLDISFASKPFVRVRIGDREGNFLIDTGATQSSVDARWLGVAAGSHVNLRGASLPTLEGELFDTLDLSQQQQFAPPGGHAGTIGTDILGSRTVEFHYEAPQPYLVLSRQSCAQRSYEDAGFVSIDQHGFRASNTLWSWAKSQLLGPGPVNLPIIYLRVGTVTAPLWLDSGWGYGTSKHLSIIINTALLEQLRGAGIAMAPSGTAINSDCQGTRSEDALWQVDGAPLMFSKQDGQPLLEYAPPTFQVRGKSACNTIGNWPTSLGAVGALILPRWGTIVLDGINERVWVPKAGAISSPNNPYRSIALARSDTGGLTAATRDTLESATADSLNACNQKQGHCELEATIGPSHFLCYGIAKSQRSGSRPSQAISSSLATARSAALDACARSSGAACNLEFSDCND